MNKIEPYSESTTKPKKKITIGFIFNHPYFLGGGEVSFFELIRTIDKKKFNPVVIVPASGEIERKLKKKKIEVHCIKFPSIKNALKLFPLKIFFNLVFFIIYCKYNSINFFR